MTLTTLATKFEVGKTYYSENGVKTYTVIKRTDKTVWLETEDNMIIQKRVKVTNFGNEKITDNFLETTSDCETTVTPNEPLDATETVSEIHSETSNESQLKGWEYINSQAEYENRRNDNYTVFSKLSTANYNGEFYGYFEKVYNWIDEKTSKQLDVFATEFKDIDPKSHYINFYYRAMELYQATPLGNPNKTSNETPNEPQDAPETNQDLTTTMTPQEFINKDIQAETIAETLQDLSYWLDMIVTEDNDEPCTTVTEPTNETTLEPITESQDNQDNQDELVKTYEVSTVEGLENDDQPEYNAYIVTAPNPSNALETIKTRLMSQKTRFNILGVCEAPMMIDDDDEWLEF